MKRVLIKISCGVIPAVLALGACGGDSGSQSSVMIKAAEGGTVELGTSKSSLNIPANALAADTDVSLSTVDGTSLPKLENVAKMLEIRPAGTVLETAATLTVTLDTPMSSGDEVKVHQLRDGAWAPLEIASGTETDVIVAVLEFTTVAVTVKKADDKTPSGSGNQIVGKALWSSGDVAADLPLELHRDGAKLTETRTDAEGKYSFVDLTAGDYEVVLTPMAECPARHAVTVTDEAATTLDITVCGS